MPSRKEFPDKIAVIGGGRWARVIVDTLYKITPASIPIHIHTLRNAANMEAWIVDQKMNSRVVLENKLPDKYSEICVAAIIANQVCDHKSAILQLLNAGANVLVEKPFTTSFEDSKTCTEIAKSLGLTISTAHVFLFANYFETFSKLIEISGKVRRIHFIWTDPEAEIRYKEIKKYDSSITVYADWLPHVISMIHLLLVADSDYYVLSKIEVIRGGASVMLEIMYGDVEIKIELSRNTDKRLRFLEVETEINTFNLDFSNEPGKIYKAGIAMGQVVDSDITNRPLASMLTSFLKGVKANNFDLRLSHEIALIVNRIIDSITPHYRSLQLNWVMYTINNGIINKDMHYALSELLQYDGIISSDILNKRINKILFFFLDKSILQDTCEKFSTNMSIKSFLDIINALESRY